MLKQYPLNPEIYTEQITCLLELADAYFYASDPYKCSDALRSILEIDGKFRYYKRQWVPYIDWLVVLLEGNYLPASTVKLFTRPLTPQQ